MANDKKFIVKNGLLTPENAVIGSTTDTGETLQVTGESLLTQATPGTATLKVKNTGGLLRAAGFGAGFGFGAGVGLGFAATSTRGLDRVHMYSIET